MISLVLSVVILANFIGNAKCYNVDVDNVMKFTGSRNVYFGYVTELLKNAEGYWLLVTAPKDQQTWNPEVQSPGAVYHCKIDVNRSSTGSCTQVPANFKSGQALSAAIEVEANQFLGASMAVKPDQSEIVTCAPLYKFIFNNLMQYPLGRCYFLNSSDFSLVKANGSMPFIPNSREHLNFFAEAGFSLTYTKEFNDLIFSAPGLKYSSGGFVRRRKTNHKQETWNQLGEDMWKYSYFGYAVDSGMPYGAEPDETLALGAPAFSIKTRRGSVVLIYHGIYRFKDEGKQLGEGFGMAVCLVDVNGDGLDDMLVGAPLHTEYSGISGDTTDDQGVVKLYFGKKLIGKQTYEALLDPKIELTGLRKAGARFGTAIVNLGDINADGYNDVAIGAPYEDSSSGAIYIYNGGSDGLRDVFSQRIAGEDVSPGKKGFGWHISSPMDVDNNSYNDFVVSSYWSEEALLFRTRPSVDLIGSLTLTPPDVPLNSSVNNCSQFAKPCLYVDLCFNYSGKFMPGSLLISYKLDADTIQTSKGLPSRVQLQLHGIKYNRLDRNISLNVNVMHCEPIIGVITSSAPENIFQVMKFDAEFKLADVPHRGGEITPILNEGLPKAVSKNATFRINCSEDVCQSDLRLKYKYQLSHGDPRFIIIVKPNFLDVYVTISNKGEPSYATIVTVSVSGGVKYIQTETQSESKVVTCTIFEPNKHSDPSFQNLICTAGNPLLKSEKDRTFKMRFDVSETRMIPNKDLNKIPEMVEVKMDAITESKLIDDKDSHKTFNVSVYLQADVQITGVSDPDQVKYRVVEDNTRKLPIMHIYGIQNLGPSVLPPTTVQIHLPISIEAGHTLVELLEPESNTECHISYAIGPQVVATTTGVSTPISTTSKWNFETIPTAKPARRKRNADPEKSQQETPLRKNITCAEYECGASYIECHINQLEAHEHITVKVRFNIIESNLPHDKKAGYLTYGSKGIVKQPVHPRLIPWLVPQVYEEVFTLLNPLIPPKEEIPLWVIIVSVVASLVILVIVIIILWRCGFFKRKKRHDVKDWKCKSGYYERRSQRSSSRSASSRKSDPEKKEAIE